MWKTEKRYKNRVRLLCNDGCVSRAMNTWTETTTATLQNHLDMEKEGKKKCRDKKKTSAPKWDMAQINEKINLSRSMVWNVHVFQSTFTIYKFGCTLSILIFLFPCHIVEIKVSQWSVEESAFYWLKWIFSEINSMSIETFERDRYRKRYQSI